MERTARMAVLAMYCCSPPAVTTSRKGSGAFSASPSRLDSGILTATVITVSSDRVMATSVRLTLSRD
jgi:hypothetical protein